MRRGPVAAILVVAVLGIALLVVYSGVLGTPAASPTTSPSTTPARRTTPPPATALLSPSPMDTDVVATAIVVPQRSADLALEISGVVDRVYVGPGDQITANELLLKLDQQTYLAQIEFSEADVRRANLALERAQLLVEQLPSDASPGQVEQAQVELRLAEAELEFARASLADAQVALGQTDVRAPFAGTVAGILVEEGEQAVAGQPVVSIGDLSGWLIETTDLSELEVVRIAAGDVATVTFPALPELEVTGTVERVQVRGTTADGDVLFAVVIRPDEHQPELRWNMTASARITPRG